MKFKILLLLWVLGCLVPFLASSLLAVETTIAPEGSPTLYCDHDIIVDAQSGAMLYGKNETEKLYPASTTKILTAILTLEHLDLDMPVTVTQKMVNDIPIGSSVMGVKAGEIFTVEQLLYGLLLPSGNDAAIVLAEAVSKDIDTFVALMNTKAKELGCSNTHFTNPHGFHDDNHYTTAADMAKIFQYCLKNDTFKEMISAKSFPLPSTNKTEETRTLYNTNRMTDKNYPTMYYPYIMGGKTGYTIEARGTFIGYAKKDDKTVIVGCFNGSQKLLNSEARFLDAKALCEYVFDNFQDTKVLNQKTYSFKISDDKKHNTYTVGVNQDAYQLLKDKHPLIQYHITVDFKALDSLGIKGELTETEKKASIGSIELAVHDNGTTTLSSYPLLLQAVEHHFMITDFMKYLPLVISGLAFILMILVIWRWRCRKQNTHAILQSQAMYETIDEDMESDTHYEEEVAPEPISTDTKPDMIANHIIPKEPVETVEKETTAKKKQEIKIENIEEDHTNT